MSGTKLPKALFKKENMIVTALVGILLLVIAIPVEEKKEESIDTKSGLLDTSTDMLISSDPFLDQATQLEQRVASFLSCMEGAGEVRVLITFSSSEENVVEKDASGSSWQDTASANTMPVVEETVFSVDRQGLQTPYVKKTLAAAVEGVTVLAQGGDQPVIQKQITEMIEALFGIEPHKIRVAKMK